MQLESQQEFIIGRKALSKPILYLLNIIFLYDLFLLLFRLPYFIKYQQKIALSGSSLSFYVCTFKFYFIKCLQEIMFSKESGDDLIRLN